MSPTRPSMLTVLEVAAELGVSKMTVYRLIHREDLRAVRVGRSLRVPSRDLETFLRGADTFTWGASA